MTTFNSRKAIRKALTQLIKADAELDATVPFARVRKIFQMLSNHTGSGKILPTDEDWKELINGCKDTSTGVSVFHRFTFMVGTIGWNDESKTLLAFFLAYGANPMIVIAQGKTKNKVAVDKMKNIRGKTAIQLCGHEEMRKMLKKWCSVRDDTIKRTEFLRSLTQSQMKSVTTAIKEYATKIRKKYVDPDGTKDVHLDTKTIEVEVDAYLDWRNQESCGLAHKLDMVSELSTKDPYGRHLIHTILYRELMNREMVKWIHHKIYEFQ